MRPLPRPVWWFQGQELEALEPVLVSPPVDVVVVLLILAQTSSPGSKLLRIALEM